MLLSRNRPATTQEVQSVAAQECRALLIKEENQVRSADGEAVRPLLALVSADLLTVEAEAVIAGGHVKMGPSRKFMSLVTPAEIPAVRNWNVTSPEMVSRWLT